MSDVRLYVRDATATITVKSGRQLGRQAWTSILGAARMDSLFR